jgi:hypothetical protein
MEQPSWAAVIPNKYLYAKDINAVQKILIGLISGLSNIKGYCFATNDYFSEILDLSKVRVSQLITDLEKKGYLGRVIYRNDKQQVEKRILILIMDKEIDLPLKFTIPPIENDNTLPLEIIIPPIRNFKDNKNNNKNINNNNNNRIQVKPTQQEVIDFFISKGSTEEKAKQAYEYYEVADWHDAKGNRVKNWKQKMLSVWINNNNFTKTTKTQNNAKSTSEYYKEHYDRNLKWATEWDIAEGRQPFSTGEENG